jgi:nucleolar protein 4
MSVGNKRRKLSNDNYEALSTSADQPAKEGDTVGSNSRDQRRSLFVRSLPASVTTERLTEHFSESFPLKHATVVLDPQTKISKGFGFVTFADAEDAQAAIAQFNNSELDGRKIKVELAESRHRDNEEGGKSGPNTTGVQLRAQREKSKGEVQPPKLIVRNLPWSIKTGEDLSLLFRSYGKVKHAVVPTKGPRVQYGFGIVILRGRKNAEKALAGINGKEVDGRTLAVDWAVDKETWEEQKDAVADEQQADSAVVANGVEVEPKDPQGAKPAGGDSDSGDMSDEDDIDDLDAEVDLSHLGSDDEDDEKEEEQRENKNDTTVFIRNLPYSADDDILKEHFSAFGPIRYARVVYDQETERPKGTAFVCFFNEDDAKACVKDAPKHEGPVAGDGDKKRKSEPLKHSVLQNEATDPSGKYTMEGRVLQVSRALTREDAGRRADEASEKRDVRDRDKRRLYLLSEGTISASSKLYTQLGKAEIDVRESSAKQRQRLIKSNPNLCLSLTRLSVRNIPRGVGSKELKALAREAVVGFATDVKAGLRQPLNKEELRRGEEEMREAERLRKLAGKGIVRQAKVVFEDKEGGKVKEGAGRSRGYGFVEYTSHRNALAGLRWLNGHLVKAGAGGADPAGGAVEKGKRLVVEFAIENAQVMQRRQEREKKSKEFNKDDKRPYSSAGRGEGADRRQQRPRDRDNSRNQHPRDRDNNRKRKRGDENTNYNSNYNKKTTRAPKPADSKSSGVEEKSGEEKNRIAKRNRIISKKRQARKTRKS